ncbi:MAG: hypothetical protein IJH71_11195 [Eubacterium sp.]|nr:hypothetical protein [Eubacterium sp.]
MIGIRLDMAPQKGYLLAYFRDALVFEPYTIENGRLVFPECEVYQEMSPKECHLFDENTEYRMIFREARDDRVEVILTRQEEETMDPNLIYEEEVLVKNEYSGKAGIPKSLKVINRYMYTENDTLVLKNYRIAC